MRNCNRKINLALLALIAAGLLAVPPETQAQEPENFVWVTNTNGLTWKKEILDQDKGGGEYVSRFFFYLAEGVDKREIAQIVVPEHAIIASIDVEGCVNLTNIVIHPPYPRTRDDDGQVSEVEG